jgi:hypothetical protein
MEQDETTGRDPRWSLRYATPFVEMDPFIGAWAANNTDERLTA